MVKLTALCVALVLTACADNPPPPATQPAPAQSAAPEKGAPELQGFRHDLDTDLARIDLSLKNTARRIEGVRDDVKADLNRRLVELQRRDDELKAQLRELAARADAEADKARTEIHHALVAVEAEAQRLAESVTR